MSQEKRKDIYAELETERLRQDAEHGGAEHDDTHAPSDWRDFIEEHLARAFRMDIDRDTYRNQMLRVGALAVAAVESFDRWAERSRG